jgi:Fe-S-cluster containining protein
MNIPPFTTSEECLSCRGCCLFQQTGGDWSPRLTPDDVEALVKAAPRGVWREGHDRIVLTPCRAAHACSFLDEETHHCRVYDARPLECALYPFLISSEKDGFRIYAHLSCPAISAAQRAGTWGRDIALIKAFFARPEMQRFVQRHASCFPDYSLSRDEVEEVLAFDPAADLWRQRPVIERALAMRPRALSSLAFVNMFAWQEHFSFSVENIAGAACVFASQPVGTFLYFPPLARDIPPAAVDACFEKMRRMNRGGSLTRIENVAEEELPAFDPAKYRSEERGHEYVYARSEIVRLGGNDHKSRRHEVNVFLRAYGDRSAFRPYAPADFNACAILFDRWLDGRVKRHDNEAYGWMLAENRAVHRLVLAHAACLGLIGRVVEIDGRIAAYSFGYALTPDTFCVLFEVADLEFKGLAAFIFSRFCADDALRCFKWINAMDDFEAPGLARAKLSWRPVRLQPVYALMPREM